MFPPIIMQQTFKHFATDTPTYASFTSISRSIGPLAGGTWLTLSGVNLENFPVVGAYFVPATSGYETLYGLAGKSDGYVM